MRFLALVSLLLLSGCAARAIPVAIGVACYSCQWIEASGVCTVPGLSGMRDGTQAKPYCPPGYQPYLLNFEQMMKRGEQPRIVCK